MVGSLDIFTTCPQSKDHAPGDYLARVSEIARWSETFGARGILVYTDNGLIDPWLVSQSILQSTTTLCPLIAIQPIYMHPYSAAKMVSSLAFLHGRRVYLNMLAGGFRNDLIALGDETPHDDRYLRTTEYTLILKQLLRGGSPVTFEGRYYTARNLRMTPPLPDALQPGLLISGSSDAGAKAAREIGATAVVYPGPASDYTAQDRSGVGKGVRIGIIARADSEEAWSIARNRFPADREGALTHHLAMKVSDSTWHRQLSEKTESGSRQTYWLGPFQHYKTFCPYLVGSHSEVAAEIATYITSGFRTFILDIPPAFEDLENTSEVFRLAVARAGG